MSVSTRRLTVALFDMDGLLLDTESIYFEAAVQLCANHGRKADRASIIGMIGKNVLDGITLLKRENDLGDSVEKLIVEYHDVFERLVSRGLRTMPGVATIIASCRSTGLRRAVVTSTDRVRATDLLHKSSLAGEFEQVFTADDIQNAKPAPDIYLFACRSLGVRPEETIAFEDSLHGVRAAKTAGCLTVAVPNRYLDKHDFVETDLRAERLDDADVLALIASRAGR